MFKWCIDTVFPTWLKLAEDPVKSFKIRASFTRFAQDNRWNFRPLCVWLITQGWQVNIFFQDENINLRYAWLGKSLLKSFLSSIDSQKVFLRSALCPQITMVPTQLSICLLFIPRNPHNRVFKISSSSSTHTIGLKYTRSNVLLLRFSSSSICLQTIIENLLFKFHFVSEYQNNCVFLWIMRNHHINF